MIARFSTYIVANAALRDALLPGEWRVAAAAQPMEETG